MREVRIDSIQQVLLFDSAKEVMTSLRTLRFLDLHPDAMRLPSLPHQTVLGDRGENLSSVLQTICTNSQRKEILIQWLQALTPMDAKDFEFLADYTGRILVHLLENHGRITSAYSASDGTLRFLAMMAALLGPKAATVYFFEELENGIHPNRLYLLMELIEKQVKQSKIQIIATTHSPNLLGFASQETLKAASLVYRLPDQTASRIQRIVDIPEILQFIEAGEMARLHESGWFENVVAFMQDVGHED
jgi:predicted ATPase